MTFKKEQDTCWRCGIEHGMEKGNNGCQNCKRSIGKDGAKFSLEGAPGPHFVINMDCIQSLSNKRRCDYIFITTQVNCEVCWIVPIEITSGKGKKEKDILEQLQCGAKFAERTFGSVKNAKFKPVLVGNVKGWQIKLRQQIKYFDDKYVVEKIGNGGKLADALR